MKWLRSTTHLTYTAVGKTIPAFDKKPLCITEETYSQMLKMSVIKSLIAKGGIIVLESYEDEDVVNTSSAELSTLRKENARLNKQLTESAASVKQLAKEQKTREKLEKELAQLHEKYAQLESEANAKIAELSAKE